MDFFKTKANKLVQSLYMNFGEYQLHLILNEMIDSFKTQPKYQGFMNY